MVANNLHLIGATIVLVAHSIQDAIAAKRRRYDFLRGNEEYKYRFGAKDAGV